MKMRWSLLWCLCSLIACKVTDFKQLSENKIKDTRDGEVYGTVKIGEQLWMSDNMRYKVEGSELNLHNLSKEYGRLYTWEQAMRACPEGWHLPSDEEWKELERHLGMSQEEVNAYAYRGDIGGKLKSISRWQDIEGVLSHDWNSSGFNALPSGSYWSGFFNDLGKKATFWSSTEKSSIFALGRSLSYNNRGVRRHDNNKLSSESCRCLKNKVGFR